MPVVNINNLGKSFGAERIFSGISFQVEPQDRIGLVGPNGAGKSTLLNILAKREEPDEGSIALARNTRLGYLTQVTDFHAENTLRAELLSVFAQARAWERELGELAIEIASVQDDPVRYEKLLRRYDQLQLMHEHAGGYTYENRVEQVMDGLEFTREQQESPVMQLSGGQQTRAALGKLLLQEPEVLLLDEPTNHLDLATLEWLEGYLTAWHGAMVIVAHDRYFLDKVVTRTIELAFGRIEEYPGNYTKYLSLREERMEQRRREYEAQQAYIAHTEEFIRKYKAGQRSREARGRQTLLNRMDRVERPQDMPEMHFEFTPVNDSGTIVIETHKLTVGYRAKGEHSTAEMPEDKVLVQVPELELLRGDRVGLLGPNGAGKTTLLRTLIGELPPLNGHVNIGRSVRVGYYSQTHSGLDMERTIVDEIRQVSALSEEGARSLLGRFLFSGDDVFKPIGKLSGGERSRVALAKLTLQGPNLMILDEPTNHLDLQSRQFLEEILSEFEGSLLFVSHDRYFIDSLATRIWAIEDGVLNAYQGNYTEYRQRRQQSALNAASASTPAKTVVAKSQPAKAVPANKGNKKGSKEKVRTLEAVERDVEKAEAQVKSLEDALSQAALEGNAEQLTQLSAEYEEAKARLDVLLAEWEQLADMAS
ncbi:ribosomal protection-like ABC-F family protein [Dictyobacter arantiisoli]|uniref:ABC transporter n=1 Tax=Dictyobacter arantiisoli TaxID=2014874 RepID=A0A5A5TFF2_9CHLR|nr:ABC-F family ATP-binding cassette domain-containing protein [Dictyobacter arantiisoli]GCF09729.1 ABC transporter [Dictyobacter arantiisoli]